MIYQQIKTGVLMYDLLGIITKGTWLEKHNDS